MTLPETTIRLLRAAQNASETTDKSRIERVEIRNEWKASGIFYYPQKTRYTSKCVELAGIADLVTLFIFDNTRHLVERHFRPGVYDISEREIKILK